MSSYRTWVEINSAALRSNIGALRSILNPDTKFCAVVKSNAYGHDTDTIVRLAALEGVNFFGVDSVDEGIIVRRRAPDAQIIILGYTMPERYEDVVRGNFIQTIYSADSIKTLSEIACKMRSVALVNIKVETGTNRQGAKPQQLAELLRMINSESQRIRLEGISSHFCDAENADDQSLVHKQLRKFNDVAEAVNGGLNSSPLLHIACSAAAMLDPSSHFSMARFGIAMYGLWSSKSLRDKLRPSGKVELSPVMSVKTRIAQVKDVPAGEYIGYSRAFLSDRPMRIAILPIGYYDGYKRGYAGSDVLLHGQRCKIIGNICMNMCIIDVSAASQAKTGEIVTLIGRDGMNQVTAEDLASTAGTINYEVVTSIAPHLPRIVI